MGAKPSLEKHILGLANKGQYEELQKAFENSIDIANCRDVDGTSLLDVQRGIFNVVQGMAYRVHKCKYAADYHTHEKDKNYPYLFKNFVEFVEVIMNVYKSVDIIPPNKHEELNKLCQTLRNAEKRILERMKKWSKDDEDKWLQRQHERKEKREREKLESESIPFPDTPGPQRALSFSGMMDGVKVVVTAVPNWLKNTQIGKTIAKGPQKEGMYTEGFGVYDHRGDSRLFLEEEFRIFYDKADEDRPGCFLEVSFWYKEFMPQLLAVCSIGAYGYDSSTNKKFLSESHLDTWFKAEKKSGRLAKYGGDIVAEWKHCDHSAKLSIKRAWRLTMHYFLGPQKQRERSSESGVDHRQSGDLSQYVAFMDVWVQKNYVQEEGMRLTFPYFIGPTTWIWHHFLGERANSSKLNADQKSAIVKGFKEYFKLFVTLYPCPYCRHHLNESVYINGEKEMFPVEYLFVGWMPSKDKLNCDLKPGDKLNYITDTLSLRLFIWKLHNAVSSSIARQEQWYHQAASVNTSRYWPNIEATLYRAENYSGVAVAKEMRKIVEVLRCAMRLEVLRHEILQITEEHVEEMAETVKPLIEDLDKAILESGLLHDAYAYQPDLIDEIPNWEDAEARGSQIRSEFFTLN
eukprot:m.63316 g.63316  ORF g.63316 m.63316 type:complete len:630 (+) comp11574_c0_seq2:221-2110(+)